MRVSPPTISFALLGAAALLQVHCSGGGEGAASTSSSANEPGTPKGGGSSSGSNGSGSADASAGGGPGTELPDGAVSGPPPVINFVAGVTVSTLAGSATPGEVDGTGAAAQFDNPTGIEIDHNGNLVVVDYDGWAVRVVTPSGSVSTLVKGGLFSLPFAVTVTGDGSYFVSTDDDPSDAGTKTPVSGAVWSVPQAAPGTLVSPSMISDDMARPRGIAPDGTGALFVAEEYRNVVGSLDTGSGTFTQWAGGTAGYQDGVGAQAAFNTPLGGALLADGSFAVADALNGSIRRVTSSGAVTTIAGTGTPGGSDGPCATAQFGYPHDVAVDAAGNLYVSDGGAGQRIRRIRTTASGCIVETLAGNGVMGFADGPGQSASFYGAEGLDVTPDGTTVYVADGNLGSGAAFHRVRALSVPPITASEDSGAASGEDAGGATGAAVGEDAGNP